MVCMRCFRFAMLMIPFLALPAAAQGTATPEQGAAGQAVETIALPPEQKATEPATVQGLLTELRRERDPDKAQAIARQLIAMWDTSDSATVNLLMEWTDKAIAENREAAALDFLSQAISLEPGFVGAWNKRATLHYTDGDFAKSMADINQVLKIEPHHFGALAGMASILDDVGREKASLKAWESYLSIYPADRKAQDVVTKMSEKLAGSRL